MKHTNQIAAWTISVLMFALISGVAILGRMNEEAAIDNAAYLNKALATCEIGEEQHAKQRGELMAMVQKWREAAEDTEAALMAVLSMKKSAESENERLHRLISYQSEECERRIAENAERDCVNAMANCKLTRHWAQNGSMTACYNCD